MKTTLSLLILILSFSLFGQSDCINFGNYDNAFLNDVSTDNVTYPIGDAFITEGDIQLIKPDGTTLYQNIDSAQNEMLYIGNLGIDVSSSNFGCRKLTFGLTGASTVIVDGESIPASGTYTYNGSGWTATCALGTSVYEFTIEGDFDYVEIGISTALIRNICLESCSSPSGSCVQFGNYDNNFLNDVTADNVTYPPGDAFITEGDIQLIKPNTSTFYQFIDSAENEMCYIGELGIDVSSASYNCRKLTFNMVAGLWFVVDGDTIPTVYEDTTYIGAGWTLDKDTANFELSVTIEGDFDYVEIGLSTICISDICLEPCATSSGSCVDFTNYTSTFLDDVTMDNVTYPPGDAFITEGDIQLIKPNTSTFYQWINAPENEMCYIGNLGIDVSSASYNCRKLSFNLVAGMWIVIDNDTIPAFQEDTTYSGAGWTADKDTANFELTVTIEGDFDYVEISMSTICISDICLEPCTTSSGSCVDFTNYDVPFLNDVTTDHVTYPPGDAFITEGDIQLIKPNTSTVYQWINAPENEMCYIGELGIDVSSAAYDCRKLTFNMVAGLWFIVDGDTIPSLYEDTTYTGAGWTLDKDTANFELTVTIEGEFDYVEIGLSTICISDICLEPCTTISGSCVDFTNYTSTYLDDVSTDHITYPPGDAFITEGDIQLIKPNTTTFYQWINAPENEMCYIGELGVDVSSASYNCRILTFDLVAGLWIVVDGDTIPALYEDTTYTGSGWTLDKDTANFEMTVTIEGEFDYVEIGLSTICISNICLAPCSVASIEKPSVEINSEVLVYPNPTNGWINFSTEKTVKNVFVYNSLGQQVIKVNYPNNSLDLSRLAKGMYILLLEDDNGEISSHKIMKE